MESNTRPICVLGMHRSGTSMVTQLLAGCGVYLGEHDDLVAADQDNADGYWENKRFVDINEAVFALIGAGWDHPAGMPEGWESDGRFLRLRSRGLQLVEAFRESVWGWKDPRTTLVVPFWRSILPHLRPLICIRNPLDVALSLHRRNNFSYEAGIRLWYDYNLAALRALEGVERVVTHYDVFFERPAEELARVASALELEVAEDIVAKAASVVKPSLRHAAFGFDALLEAEVRPEVLRLYAMLCRDAGVEVPPGVDDIRESAQNRGLRRHVLDTRILQDRLAASEDLSLRAHLRLAEQDAMVAEMRQRLQQAEESLGQLEKQLESESSNREQLVQGRLRELNQSAAELADRAREAAELHDRVKGLEGELAATREGFEAVRAALRRERQLADGRDNELNGAHQLLLARDKEVAELRQVLTELERELREAREAAESARTKLAEIHRSRLWKIGSAYWRVRQSIGVDPKDVPSSTGR